MTDQRSQGSHNIRRGVVCPACEGITVPATSDFCDHCGEGLPSEDGSETPEANHRADVTPGPVRAPQEPTASVGTTTQTPAPDKDGRDSVSIPNLVRRAVSTIHGIRTGMRRVVGRIGGRLFNRGSGRDGYAPRTQPAEQGTDKDPADAANEGAGQGSETASGVAHRESIHGVELDPDEEVVWSGNPSWITYIPEAVLVGVVLGAVVITARWWYLDWILLDAREGLRIVGIAVAESLRQTMVMAGLEVAPGTFRVRWWMWMLPVCIAAGPLVRSWVRCATTHYLDTARESRRLRRA